MYGLNCELSFPQFHRERVDCRELLILVFQFPFSILPSLEQHIIYVIVAHVFFDLLLLQLTLKLPEFIKSSDPCLISLLGLVFQSFDLFERFNFIMLHFAFHPFQFSGYDFLNLVPNISRNPLPVVPVTAFLNHIPLASIPPLFVPFGRLLLIPQPVSFHHVMAPFRILGQFVSYLIRPVVSRPATVQSIIVNFATLLRTSVS